MIPFAVCADSSVGSAVSSGASDMISSSSASWTGAGAEAGFECGPFLAFFDIVGGCLRGAALLGPRPLTAVFFTCSKLANSQK